MTGRALRRRHLAAARRIVVKIGSSLLAPGGRGVRRDWVRALCAQVADLRRRRREVVLVSSGAIATGRGLLGVARRPGSVAERQALAAVGQPELMRAWAEGFRRFRIPVAQVLLTRDDLTTARRRAHARRALAALLAHGVVPVVNENDIVAVEEIRMGDNDLLSAHVARFVAADALVILSDVDGLYVGPPRAGAARMDIVRRVTPTVRGWAGRGPGSAVGSGGMRTKLDAAARATREGVPVVIARGTDRQILTRVMAGDSVGTLFLPS